MSKKHRADSKLKTLPPPVQAELFAICKGPDGYAKAREWLKSTHGLTVKSDSTFSAFFGWYPFSLSATADYVTQFAPEFAKLDGMQGDAEKLSRLSQLGFEMLAMRTQDLEGFVQLKKIRLAEHDQSLTERRVVLLEKKAAQADEAKKVTDNAELSDADKLARYKAIFGS